MSDSAFDDRYAGRERSVEIVVCRVFGEKLEAGRGRGYGMMGWGIVLGCS